VVTYRVLVVDDHKLWRDYFSSALRGLPQWQIIGEASDGLEAVKKAQELKPDLILLDVGLPTMDGIQAARRILADDPSSRILFVSEQRLWEVAEAALSTGARGYVVKADAGRELRHAMDAIVGGRRFISARWGGRVVEATSNEGVAPVVRRHEAGFYSDEPTLLDDYARFAEAALGTGHSVIALLTDSGREQVHLRLQARGVDVESAARQGRYVWLDVATALSSFMVDGWPDEARFWSVVHPLAMQAARASKAEHPRIAAFGECAPGLLRDGKAAAAIRLEQLWDDACRTYEMDTFCGYLMDVPRSGEHGGVFQEICAAHSAIYSR